MEQARAQSALEGSGNLLLAGSPLGGAVWDAEPKRRWIRITGGTNPYSWESVQPDDPAMFSQNTTWLKDNLLSGTTTQNAAIEVNGHTDVPVNSIVSAVQSSGYGALYFEFRPGGPGDSQPITIINNFTTVNNTTINITQNVITITTQQTDVTITGIIAPTALPLIFIYNAGTFPFKLAHESTLALANTRIFFSPEKADRTIVPNQWAVLIYNLTSQPLNAPRWNQLDCYIAPGFQIDKSPASNQNDYDIQDARVARVNPSEDIDITGFKMGWKGRHFLAVCNVSADKFITLKNQSASSAAVNRMNIGLGSDLILDPGAVAILIYDATSERWRLAANYPGSGGGVGGVAPNAGLWPDYHRGDLDFADDPDKEVWYPVGNLITQDISNLVNITLNNVSELWAMPLKVTRIMTIDNMGIRCEVADAINNPVSRLGIYRSVSINRFYPGALVYSPVTELSLSTTGAKKIGVANFTATTLTPGLYWVALNTSTTNTASIRGFLYGLWALLGYNSDLDAPGEATAGVPWTMLTVTSTYPVGGAAFPDPFPTGAARAGPQTGTGANGWPGLFFHLSK